ncbi:MAG: DUF120 domain-containing protein [Candidatus Thorarchaeota archaeon]|jgi:riboflavin kinase
MCGRTLISPEIWFTLYSLARKGAIHDRITLTTRELGEALDVSQQTASRRITFCVERGFVKRAHTASGMLVQLTDIGVKELTSVVSNLETALAPPIDEIVIKGSIVHGLGEGAYYVEVYASRFKEALGFEPYLGTLNVRIVDESSDRAISKMKHTPPLVVNGFSLEGRTFGDVICYRVKVNNTIEAAIVIAQRTHHGENILEVIAPINIRKKLKLKDDDSVTLTVIPLHMAT